MKTWKTALKVEGFIAVVFLVLPIVMAFLMWGADGKDRPGFADAHVFSVRQVMSVVVLMLMMLPIFYVADRRPPGTPLTWGEAMVAATYIFFLLFWLYGVLPHEYINWADSELQWRADKKIIGPEGTWASWWSFWKKIPLTIDKSKIRDVMVVVIYVVGLGGLIWGWAFWNDRQKKLTEAAELEPVSRYGRPLVAKAGPR